MILNGLKLYEEALRVREKTGNERDIAESLNNIGFIYSNQGQVKKALEYQLKALRIMEKIKDNRVWLFCLNNVALIYQSQGDKNKSKRIFGPDTRGLERIGLQRWYRFLIKQPRES